MSGKDQDKIYIDWRGSDFLIGETVIYPVRSGSHLYIVEGVILDIVENEKQDPNYFWKNFHLIVQPLLENRYPRPKLRNKDRPVKLTATDKVTAIHD